MNISSDLKAAISYIKGFVLLGIQATETILVALRQDATEVLQKGGVRLGFSLSMINFIMSACS